MFHNTNPTNKYLVAIDSDIAILFDDKSQALAAYNQVQSIEESPFGAMCFMIPHQVDKNIYGDVAEVSILFDRKIVNVDYIEKHTDRRNKRYAGRKDVLATSTAKQRLTDAKVDFMAALGFKSVVDWRKNRAKVA